MALKRITPERRRALRFLARGQIPPEATGRGSPCEGIVGGPFGLMTYGGLKAFYEGLMHAHDRKRPFIRLMEKGDDGK